jgi:hypothetical protein
MKRICNTVVVSLAVLVFTLGIAWGQTAKTDKVIRQEIISDSIANYRGNCPCPYSAAKGGRRCGARSAYSRPGGASPLCYEEDVTQKMVNDYRKRSKQ